MDRFAWLELRPVRPEIKGAPRPAKPPQDAASYCQCGRAMRLAGHFRDAAHYYQHALGLNERLYSAHAEMVDCLVRAGLLDEAESSSANAIEHSRQVRLYYAARALVVAHRGNLAEAFSLSDVSLEQNSPWYSRLVRAELLIMAGRDHLPEVLATLEALQESATEPWETGFLGGWMLLHGGLPAHASGHFAEAVHADPMAVAGWIGLGDAFHALRLYDQALFYYQRATEIEPTHELALERQRQSAFRRFGLLRMFTSRDIRARWNRRFEQEVPREEPPELF